MTLQQVAALLLDPLGPDDRIDSRVRFAGIDNFGRHQPFRCASEQSRTGENMVRTGPGAGVTPVFRVFPPAMTQQPGQQAFVNLFKITVMTGQAPAALPGQVPQLLIKVKPLQHALPVQKFPAAQLAELVAGNRLALFPQVLPKLQQGREIGFIINEPLMRLVCCGLFFQRPFTGILDTERCRQHQHVFQALCFGTFLHYPRQADIKRPARQGLAEPGGRTGLINRRQLEQQLVSVIDHPRSRAIDKGKILHRTQAHGQHPQDHRRQ